jgi:predicted Fe-Mo cluster-binding NifX family protein
MKLLIAIDENEGLISKLSSHFGRCPFFGIFETETKELTCVKNEIDHSIDNITPVDQIIHLKPEIIITKGIGPKAINLFKEKNILVKVTNYSTIQEVVDNLEQVKDSFLDETSSCSHN